jgi:hypothetical protein
MLIQISVQTPASFQLTACACRWKTPRSSINKTTIRAPKPSQSQPIWRSWHKTLRWRSTIRDAQTVGHAAEGLERDSRTARPVAIPAVCCKNRVAGCALRAARGTKTAHAPPLEGAGRSQLERVRLRKEDPSPR